MTTVSADLDTLLRRIQRDPCWYARHVLGLRLYDRQEEILNAVRDYVQVSVSGANGIGKDYVTGAALLLWWLHSHSEAKAIVIAPTHRQVRDIVFRELRVAYHSAPAPLGGKLYLTPRYEVGDDRFAMGFATSDPYNIQGFHSPNLLVVVSEAHNVEETHFDAIRRLLPRRLLLTGNPFSQAGTFYESHHGHREQWHAISLSALDSPNVRESKEVIPGLVTMEDMARLKEEWGETSALYQAGILGQWPTTLEDAVFSLSLAKACIERARTAEPLADAQPHVIACDVARFGTDKTVIYERMVAKDGLVLARKLYSGGGLDVMQVAGLCVKLRRERDAKAIIVDDTGVGGGVTDRLRELGEKVVAFNFGGRAHRDDRYADAGTEAWYNLREMAEQGALALIDDAATIGQLTSRKYKLESNGRLKLESKDDMRKRGLKSPDEADALAMACYLHGRGGFKVWI